MSMTEENEPLCEACNRPRADHAELHHDFIDPRKGGRLPTPKELESRERYAIGRMGESQGRSGTAAKRSSNELLVLKVALLRAGVLTPAQLDEAERLVTEGGVIFVLPEHGDPRTGDPGPGPSGSASGDLRSSGPATGGVPADPAREPGG